MLLSGYIPFLFYSIGNLKFLSGMTSEATLSNTSFNEGTSRYVEDSSTEPYYLTTSEAIHIGEDTTSYRNDTEAYNLMTSETTDHDEETTSHQNDFTTESNDPMTSGTTEIENASIAFYLLPENVSQIEMYVGMQANVSMVAEFPPGLYNELKIKLGDERLEHIDIGSVYCFQGESITSQHGIRVNTSHNESSFRRDSMVGYSYFMLNVSGDSNQIENRQVICNFIIYLHNADGLTDEQNIYLRAGMEINLTRKDLNFEKNLTIVARTSLLVRNKVDHCEMNSSAKLGEKGKVVRIPALCWNPSYAPNIKIIVKEDNVTDNTLNIFSIYVRLQNFGDNFTPGAEVMSTPTSYKFFTHSPGYLKFELRSPWVNREYLYTDNSTDKDLLEFEIGVTLSQSTSPGRNYTIHIEIHLNEQKHVESSVIITAAEPSSSADVRDITLYRRETNELFPSNQVDIFLKLTLPKGLSQSLNLDVYTQSQNVLDESALVIKQININRRSKNIFCLISNLSIITRNFSVQKVTHLKLDFTNTKEQKTGSITLIIKCEIDATHAKFGAYYNVFVKTHTESNYTVRLNKPEILHDTSGRIFSQLYQVLDRNTTTCMDLPMNGENPPFLWLKMRTEWLQINMTTYNITLVGDGITCKRHGGRSIQISHSIGSTCPNFGCREQVKYCSVISNQSLSSGPWQECVFQCQCSGEECQTVNIVMTNNDLQKWGLCELSAKHVN